MGIVRGVYRKQAREHARDVRIVLRKTPRFWVTPLVAPLVVAWCVFSTFEVRRVWVDHGPGCDLDNCSDFWGEPDRGDLEERALLAIAVKVALVVAIGATLVFAISLEGPRTVITIDRNERVVRVSGRKLAERVSFAEVPALVVHDRRLTLTAGERPPIVLTRWHTQLATIDRLRAELADAIA